MIKKLPQLSFWKIVAVVIFGFALIATFLRFGKGLGAATHLTDEFPWGIWIGFDILVGVGLAAGGFVIAATVHIFNLEKYEAISRPSILTAFLGYLLVIVALLFDLGRPYRVWHPLVMWNPHSVMFEVGWCVTLYTIVLALEFSPIVLERFKLKVPLKIIRMIYLPVVIAGVLLSTLHQSSLGTLYVLVPDKLHGLWYSPLLPVFFFITAIAAGLAMTIMESFLSFRAFGKRIEKDILVGIARVIVVVLAVYLVLKLQDLSQRGNFNLIFQLGHESVLFWGEIGLGVVLPMLLLFSRKMRHTQTGLFFSALLVVVGFVINRLNVSITGMLHSETYFPKWTEIAVTVGLVALGFTIFALAVKHLNVFPKRDQEQSVRTPSLVNARSSPILTGNLVLGMWAILLLGMITFGLAKNYENGREGGEDLQSQISRNAEPLDQDLDLPADITYPLGEESPGPVTFSHESHVLIQERPECASCHSGLFKFYLSDSSPRAPLTMEPMYQGKSCGACHDGVKAFSSEECDACHVEK